MILHTIISAKWFDIKTVFPPNKMTQQKSSQKWEKNLQNGNTSTPPKTNMEPENDGF